MIAILNNDDNIHKTETQQFRLKDILTLFKSLNKIMYGLILKLLKFRKLKCFSCYIVPNRPRNKYLKNQLNKTIIEITVQILEQLHDLNIYEQRAIRCICTGKP